MRSAAHLDREAPASPPQHRRARCRGLSADRELERSRDERRAGLPAATRRAPSNPLRELLECDFPLELNDAVDERLGPWRTSRYVHIDWHNLIHALNERIVVEDAANRCAGAHRDHPFGLRHLIVNTAERRRHL